MLYIILRYPYILRLERISYRRWYKQRAGGRKRHTNWDPGNPAFTFGKLLFSFI